MRPDLSFEQLPQHFAAHLAGVKESVCMLPWSLLDIYQQEVEKLLEAHSLEQKAISLALLLLPTKQTQQAGPIFVSS
jgi:hypothetical protein